MTMGDPMPPTPPISVVMTAYNAATTVGLAIASIIDQEFTDWELVFVDDGSEDGTLEVVSTVSDPRVRVIQMSRVGRSRAFNAAVDAARGSIIVVNDADDHSFPDRLGVQFQALTDASEVDVMGAQMRAFWGNRSWSLRYPEAHDDIVRELEAGRMPIAHAATAFRRSWFLDQGGLDESFARVEDFDLYYRARNTTRFAALSREVIRYRFKTLPFDTWRHDEDLHARACGRTPGAGGRRLGYARYRAAIWSQQRGLPIGRRTR